MSVETKSKPTSVSRSYASSSSDDDDDSPVFNRKKNVETPVVQTVNKEIKSQSTNSSDVTSSSSSCTADAEPVKEIGANKKKTGTSGTAIKRKLAPKNESDSDSSDSESGSSDDRPVQAKKKQPTKPRKPAASSAKNDSTAISTKQLKVEIDEFKESFDNSFANTDTFRRPEARLKFVETLIGGAVECFDETLTHTEPKKTAKEVEFKPLKLTYQKSVASIEIGEILVIINEEEKRVYEVMIVNNHVPNPAFDGFEDLEEDTLKKVQSKILSENLLYCRMMKVWGSKSFFAPNAETKSSAWESVRDKDLKWGIDEMDECTFKSHDAFHVTLLPIHLARKNRYRIYSLDKNSVIQIARTAQYNAIIRYKTTPVVTLETIFARDRDLLTPFINIGVFSNRTNSKVRIHCNNVSIMGADNSNAHIPFIPDVLFCGKITDFRQSVFNCGSEKPESIRRKYFMKGIDVFAHHLFPNGKYGYEIMQALVKQVNGSVQEVETKSNVSSTPDEPQVTVGEKRKQPSSTSTKSVKSVKPETLVETQSNSGALAIDVDSAAAADAPSKKSKTDTDAVENSIRSAVIQLHKCIDDNGGSMSAFLKQDAVTMCTAAEKIVRKIRRNDASTKALHIHLKSIVSVAQYDKLRTQYTSSVVDLMCVGVILSMLQDTE